MNPKPLSELHDILLSEGVRLLPNNNSRLVHPPTAPSASSSIGFTFSLLEDMPSQDDESALPTITITKLKGQQDWDQQFQRITREAKRAYVQEHVNPNIPLIKEEDSPKYKALPKPLTVTEDDKVNTREANTY